MLFEIISCYHSRFNPKPCKTSNIQFRVVRRPASSLKVSGHREPTKLDVISSEATSSKRTKIGAYSSDCSYARLSSARMTSSKTLQYSSWWSWDRYWILLLCHQKGACLRLGCHWSPQSLTVMEDSLCCKLALDSLLVMKRRSFKCMHQRAMSSKVLVL